MDNAEIKPVWNSSSFLVYVGGLTVLGAAISALSYLSFSYYYSASRPFSQVHSAGNGTMAAWSLLFLAILYALAHVLRRNDRWLAAGIFAFVSVIAWAVFLVYLFRWFGWQVSGPFGFTRGLGHWSWARLLLWALTLAAAWDARRRFRFPFIRLISAVVFWLFWVDLLTSGHGNGLAVVSLIVGLLYLAVGNVVDQPSAFWLHLLAGALIGGALFDWLRGTDTGYAFLLVFSLLFVFVAYSTKRSSWAVYGTLGFFAGTSYFSYGASRGLTGTFLGVFNPFSVYPGYGSSPWAPALAYGLLGFWLVGLGMLGRRRRRAETPEPAAV